MPVFFYLDPEFASDRGMEDVNSLVLSYTFFRSEDFDGDEYDEARGLERTRRRRRRRKTPRARGGVRRR